MYIYKRRLSDRDQYILRISKRKGDKVLVRDIANLGTDPNSLRDKLLSLEDKYSSELKKSWRTLDKTMTYEHFLDKAKNSKIKFQDNISKEQLLEFTAATLHFNHQKKNLDAKTFEEFVDSYISEYSWHTASIEGNTIPLKDAEKFFTKNKTPKDATLDEVLDLRNNKEAFWYIFNNYETLKIDSELFKKIHSMLMRDIDLRLGFRTFDVRVMNSRFKSTPYQFIKKDVEDLINWFYENTSSLHPLKLALVFHHRFEQIHPFADGNGRTGRLLMNLILLQCSCPPIMIQRKNRDWYMKCLNKADIGDFRSDDLKHYEELFSYGLRELEKTYWKSFV